MRTKTVRIGLALAVVLAYLAACSTLDGTSRSGATGDLEGAWRLVMSEVIVPNGQRIPGHAQESLLLFAGDYYSMNWATGKVAAPHSAKRLQPTDEEKVTRFGTLIVNSGRFNASNGVLTIRPEFALIPEYVGGIGEFDYLLSGNTLDLVWRIIESADGTPDPNTAVGVRFHYQFTRL